MNTARQGASTTAAAVIVRGQDTRRTGEQINDILCEMRNNMVLVKGELPNLKADAETLQAVSDAVESLVDNAETAKGALRGLRELADAK